MRSNWFKKYQSIIFPLIGVIVGGFITFSIELWRVEVEKQNEYLHEKRELCSMMLIGIRPVEKAILQDIVIVQNRLEKRVINDKLKKYFYSDMFDVYETLNNIISEKAFSFFPVDATTKIYKLVPDWIGVHNEFEINCEATNWGERLTQDYLVNEKSKLLKTSREIALVKARLEREYNNTFDKP